MPLDHISSPHLVTKTGKRTSSALIPLCQLPARRGVDSSESAGYEDLGQIEGLESPGCQGFSPTLLDHRHVCHKIEVERGVRHIKMVLDPLPHSSDPVLRVGDKGEAASSEASVYLPTLASTRSEGPGLYELTALKRMEATKSYLAQAEQVKGCSDQSFEDCKAHAFLKLTLERCSCLPWTLSGILNVSSQFSDFLSAPVNFCSPAQFRSFF